MHISTILGAAFLAVVSVWTAVDTWKVASGPKPTPIFQTTSFLVNGDSPSGTATQRLMRDDVTICVRTIDLSSEPATSVPEWVRDKCGSLSGDRLEQTFEIETTSNRVTLNVVSVRR